MPRAVRVMKEGVEGGWVRMREKWGVQGRARWGLVRRMVVEAGMRDVVAVGQRGSWRRREVIGINFSGRVGESDTRLRRQFRRRWKSEGRKCWRVKSSRLC